MGGGFKRHNHDPEEWQPLLPKDNRLKYKVLTPIALRHEPRLDGVRTGDVLAEDEEIITYDIVVVNGHEVSHTDYVPTEGDVFIDVGNGRGWAIARHPATDEDLLKPVYTETDSGFKYHVRAFFLGRDYEWSIAALIILNAIVIFVEIDYPNAAPIMCEILNSYFCILYTMEITFKIYGFGPHVFFGSYWNIFDFTVTFITVLSDMLILVLDGESAHKVRAVAPTLRLLRVLRLTNMFQGLRSLMRSFTASLGALGWITVFILLWFFLCACLTTVFIGRKEFFPDSAAASPAEAEKLRYMFHSVPYSMYSLFEIMTIDGWTGVARPLVLTQPFLLMFFFVFVFVAGFFLLNLVTAVVVDRTVAAQQAEQEAREEAEFDDSEKDIFNVIKKIKELTGEHDVIPRKTLSHALQDAEVQEGLKELNWDGPLAEAYCSVLDHKNTGEVNLHELHKEMANSVRDLTTMKLLRMQADLSVRLERRQLLIDELFRKAGKALPPH